MAKLLFFFIAGVMPTATIVYYVFRVLWPLLAYLGLCNHRLHNWGYLDAGSSPQIRTLEAVKG